VVACHANRRAPTPCCYPPDHWTATPRWGLRRAPSPVRVRAGPAPGTTRRFTRPPHHGGGHARGSGATFRSSSTDSIRVIKLASRKLVQLETAAPLEFLRSPPAIDLKHLRAIVRVSTVSASTSNGASVSAGPLPDLRTLRSLITTKTGMHMSFKNGVRPVHPGEVLREDFLRPAGLTANALAKALRRGCTVLAEPAGVVRPSSSRESQLTKNRSEVTPLASDAA
jgi:hypothetical protein